MYFDELLIKRRSIRSYKNDSVSNEILKELVQSAIKAPSAGNMQPWKFIIINDKKLLKEISIDCKINLLTKINKNPEYFASRYRHMLENPEFNIFYNAPTVILVLGNCNVKNHMVDCTLVASYLMFASASKGLGTCWVNFALSMSDSIKEKIKIPSGYIIVAPLVVGYPAVIPQMPKRKAPDINFVESEF